MGSGVAVRVVPAGLLLADLLREALLRARGEDLAAAFPAPIHYRCWAGRTGC
jgi:hypothetical protein